MPYKYDVFISYAHEDREWAEEFGSALEKLKIRTFLDTKDIRAGEFWDEKLVDSLEASQHLIIFWSKKARESDWVYQERLHFEASLKATIETPEQRNRRLLFVLLDREERAETRRQLINSILETKAYEGGVKNLPEEVRNGVLNSLVEGIRLDDTAIPISVVVIALDQGRLADLNKDPKLKVKLDNSLKAMKFGGTLNYGVEPRDWHPFGSPDSVKDILDRVKNKINQKIKIPFRWEWIGEKFYKGSEKERREEIIKLNNKPAVFVIDPISLVDPDIQLQLGKLDMFYDSNQAVIMMLSPVVPDPYCELMSFVAEIANTLYFRYYDPDADVYPSYANCCVNICDERDISRLLRMGLATQIKPPSANHVAEFPRAG
jgi:hypothetical protein